MKSFDDTRQHPAMGSTWPPWKHLGMLHHQWKYNSFPSDSLCSAYGWAVQLWPLSFQMPAAMTPTPKFSWAFWSPSEWGERTLIRSPGKCSGDKPSSSLLTSYRVRTQCWWNWPGSPPLQVWCRRSSPGEPTKQAVAPVVHHLVFGALAEPLTMRRVTYLSIWTPRLILYLGTL